MEWIKPGAENRRLGELSQLQAGSEEPRSCRHRQAPQSLSTWPRLLPSGRLASRLKAQRDSQAAKPTRVLTSKHQQDGLSRAQVRADFTDSQGGLHSNSNDSRPMPHKASREQQQHHQDNPHQESGRHAAFSDYAVLQPYSVLMLAWSVCLMCTGSWIGLWGGALASVLWFAASGSRYSTRMGQPNSGSTLLGLFVTVASASFCLLLRRSPATPGAGAMLAASLATAASLVYNMVSGGNPTASSVSSPTADLQEQTPPPSSTASANRSATSHSKGSSSHSAQGPRRGPFWSRSGKPENAHDTSLNPADRTDRALLQASSAAVSESVGDDLSPTEASAVELAIAAGLKQQLPKAIEGVFMDPDMNMRFDVTANVNTLFALVGVIFFWRGVWTLWDVGLGDSMGSEIGGVVLGLVIMAIIRWRKLPLAEGLPGV
ncbi:hypothetical protein WJX74_006404 [Apatococcus lobatus]|uniref:Uncharacterized protein n=1 Tax=Apatococcus lobatus TaxID=904363 RepID=A0AAW1Q562_9CHLO